MNCDCCKKEFSGLSLGLVVDVSSDEDLYLCRRCLAENRLAGGIRECTCEVSHIPNAEGCPASELDLPSASPEKAQLTKSFSSIKRPSWEHVCVELAKARAKRKPVKKRNAKRAAKNHARAYGDHADFIRSLPCCACGSRGLVEAAHSKTGGIGRKSDTKWLVPLCAPFPAPPFTPTLEGCHRESHRGIKTFEAKYGVDLKAIAATLWAESEKFLAGERAE